MDELVHASLQLLHVLCLPSVPTHSDIPSKFTKYIVRLCVRKRLERLETRGKLDALGAEEVGKYTWTVAKPCKLYATLFEMAPVAGGAFALDGRCSLRSSVGVWR
jgi:hypothetical protein